MRGLPRSTHAATAVPAATSRTSDVIDSMPGMSSRIARKPIRAPTSAPEMRSVAFWIVAPSLVSPTIMHVTMHVRMPGQSTALCRT